MDTTTPRLLSDEAWERIQAAFGAIKPKKGKPARSDRRFCDAVRWVLRTGAPWRDLPKTFGSWQCVYRSFSRWSKSGRWLALWRRLDAQQRTPSAPSPANCIDSISIRVHAHGSPLRVANQRQQVGRSRGGRTTKLHLACAVKQYGLWRAEKAVLSPGNLHDLCAIPNLLPPQSTKKRAIIGDKAYDAQWLRSIIEMAGHQTVIPSRQNRLPWSRKQARLYRGRNVVERAFARIKQFRRAASRFDRLAVHFGSFLQIAVSLSIIFSSALPR